MLNIKHITMVCMMKTTVILRNPQNIIINPLSGSRTRLLHKIAKAMHSTPRVLALVSRNEGRVFQSAKADCGCQTIERVKTILVN